MQLRQFSLYVIVALAVWMLWRSGREITDSLHKFRTWKRQRGVVTGTPWEGVAEASLGDLGAPAGEQIPVHPASVYSNWDHVTVLLNPANPQEKRLTGVFDFWYPTLVNLLVLGLLAATAFLVVLIREPKPIMDGASLHV